MNETNEPGVSYNRRKYWFPMLVLATSGMAALLLFAVYTGAYGYAVTLGAPFALGCALGYGIRIAKPLAILVALAVVVGLIVAAITADIAGMLCGVVVLGIFGGPVILGAVAGAVLRTALKVTQFSQREFLPVILIFVATGGAIYGEKLLVPEAPLEVVRTERILPVAVELAWDSLVFYEEIRHTPPVLARIGLPHPLYTTGEIVGVGDTKICVYDKGHLVKRITEYRPGERLAFDVIEQHGIEDRSVRLVRGSFRFERLGPARSRVVLETAYVPLLSARLVWRPFERSLAGTLHRHVLRGIELETVRRDPRLMARRGR